MKDATIFITISRGIIARNLLQNEFYGLIKRNFKKVVLITTAARDGRFRKEFGAPNVEIIPMPQERDGFWDTIVSHLDRVLIFNESTKGNILYRYSIPFSRWWWLVNKFLKYMLVRIVFKPLSKVRAARRTLQWVDYRFLQKEVARQYEDLIDSYRPGVVFVGNMLEESALLKAARRKKVPTVAMPKTWDNPSKQYFRGRADKVAVWSSFMKEEMVELQDYRESDVSIVGVPQFDYYGDRSRRESREDFCRRVGLDPKKKILCLTSEGKVMPSDLKVARVLRDAMLKRAFVGDCQLLIRPHFAYTNDEEKFSELLGTPGVVIDSCNNSSQGFSDRWDYSMAHMNHFLNILCHADVVLSTASTIALDAAALGRPHVSIAFDGQSKKPLYADIARWYVCNYLEELMRFKASLMAVDYESLLESINTLLKNPKLLEKNQQMLCDRFCHRLDGGSGERLFNFLNDICP